MFRRFEMPSTPGNDVPKIELPAKEGLKSIKSITPISVELEITNQAANKSIRNDESQVSIKSLAKKIDQVSDPDITGQQPKQKDGAAFMRALAQKKTKQPESTDAVLGAASKWKVAKKARVLGKMAVQKKEILNKNYGIDESTADKMESEQKIRCILPDNIYVKYWQRFLLILTFYLVFIYMYNVCLLSLSKDSQFMVEIVVQCCFLVDVIINFFLAYHERDELVTDLRSIMIHYLLTFFFFDLIAAVPVNLIALTIEFKPGDEDHRILRLLTMARAVKFLIGIAGYEGWKDIPFLAKRSPTIIRLIKILVLLLFFVHFSACLFVLLAKIDGSNRTWIFANENQDLIPADLYTYAVYWSTQTIVTVGFGDVIIGTNSERFMAIVLMYIGSAIYSFMISNLGAVVEEADTFETTLKAKINSFKTLAKETNLPEEIVEKVKKFIESNHKHNPRASMNDQSFINELPFTLKAQLLFNINAKVIQSVPFLKDKDVDFILKMAPNLKPIELLPKEILFRENEYPEDVFFLTSGIIHLKGKTGVPLYVISESEMFGDLEVLQNVARITTAQAQTRCSLFSIEKEVFNDILNSYTEIKDTLINEAKDKKKRLLDLKKRCRDDTSSGAQIMTGSNLRTNAVSAADYANRMYEKPTDKFEREIAAYLERGVGKKWKMKYVKRLSKRYSRDHHHISIANDSLAIERGESEGIVARSEKGRMTDDMPSETLDGQTGRTSNFKNETTYGEDGLTMADMELVNKKKKELEDQYYEQVEKVGSELATTIDTLEECNTNMKKQEGKYDRLVNLIRAIEEKQNQINNYVEMYIKKLESSAKTTTRSESFNSNNMPNID